jgi:toxin ParE1/3/4
MRRLRVVYRPEALADLDEVFEYVLGRSLDPGLTRRFLQRIRDRCRRIGETPLGGRPRDDLEPGLRTVPFERRAVIAYRVLEDVVEITNVFFGGRDYEALYTRDAEE